MDSVAQEVPRMFEAEARISISSSIVIALTLNVTRSSKHWLLLVTTPVAMYCVVCSQV